MSLPKIAIVGRQNVGKSTLANRLFGARALIADDAPGVTRDRVELEATWRGRRFALVDTAGYRTDPSGVESLTARQAARALEEADLIVVVVDVRTGVTEEDARLVERLRAVPVPSLVVANKADAPADLADAASFHALGLGEPLAISALHGTGTGDLLDRIVELLPHADPAELPDEPEPRFAIVGRPNVGKSTLFNRLVGQERTVVSDEPGTTRDAVDSIVEWTRSDGPDGPVRVRFVDTAGIRRGGKVRGVEYYGFLRATEAISRAHVVMLVLDAVEGFTAEDKRIADHVFEQGRALLVVANRWDLVEEPDRTDRTLRELARPFGRAEVVRTSATSGRGVHRLPPLLLDLHLRWSLRISTPRANRILSEVQGERPTPRGAGKLHYITQVSTGPPTFVVFGGRGAPPGAYRRSLENRIRSEVGWSGVPIRLRFRQRGR